jgi:uncharacterized membrane protein YvlD (DUF360 family)
MSPIRLVVVLLIDAAALLLLSWLLPGFTVDGAAAALFLAVVLGIANALVWPVLVRFALPFTVATLGLGALALNAAFLLAAAQVTDSVHVDGLLSAFVVVLGMTLLTTIVAGMLALDGGGELWYRHVVVRQAKRTKLAVTSDVPGLVCLEIDGLAHDVLRRALRDGNAPALARWAHDDHRLERWETGWSSQTGACQAGLLHGDDHDMPAFRWWEKEGRRALVTNKPRDAAEIERRHSDGRGLLHADGASRANILSGDAAHSMLTMSTVLDLDRPGSIGQDYFSYFASPYGVARTFLRSMSEIVVERWAATVQRRRDVQPCIHRGWTYALVRAYATVVQLDLQVAAVTADVLAGRPVVYTTFLAYDEVAHHSGVERPDTLAVLRRVDRAIERIAAATHHAPRPYRLVVLSDHGQSQGATFRQRYGEGLDDIVRRHAATTDVYAQEADSAEAMASLNAGLTEFATRQTPGGRAVRTATHGHTVNGEVHLEERPEVGSTQPPEVSVMASGNLGLIAFPREPGRVTLEQLERRRPGLVDALRSHPGIAFVLVRSARDGAVVLGPHGRRLLDHDTVDGKDPLASFSSHAVDHVRRTDGYANCPDIVVNGRYWADLDEVAAFEELVGSHGGLGGGQSFPFVLFPRDLPWPDKPVVGAAAVHRILYEWLALLGQDAYATDDRRRAAPAPTAEPVAH